MLMFVLYTSILLRVFHARPDFYFRSSFMLLRLKKVLGATAFWNVYVLKFLFPEINGRGRGHYEALGPQVT